MGHSLFASLYYLELTAAIRRSYDRPLQGCNECGIEQFANRPRVIGNADGLCGSAAQGFMHAAKIVMSDVQ